MNQDTQHIDPFFKNIQSKFENFTPDTIPGEINQMWENVNHAFHGTATTSTSILSKLASFKSAGIAIVSSVAVITTSIIIINSFSNKNSNIVEPNINKTENIANSQNDSKLTEIIENPVNNNLENNNQKSNSSDNVVQLNNSKAEKPEDVNPSINNPQINNTKLNHPADHSKVKFSDTIICTGENVRISYYPEPSKSEPEVNLILPEKQISNFNGTVSVKFNEPGSFLIWIIYSKGSVIYKEYQKIHVQIKPIASFTFDNSKNPEIQFNNNSVNAVQANWYFGDGSESVSLNPTHIYKKSGVYNVRLSVENRYGCSHETSTDVSVALKKSINEIEIPNYFSPDGDGKNDFYYIPMENEDFFELEITDRYGNRVFKSSNKNKKWDGISEFSGKECPAGQYFYVLNYRISGLETITKSGAILLIRK